MGLFDSIVDSVSDEIDEFFDDPVGKTVDVVTKPLRDGLDVVEGLTEGELRTKAVLSLGLSVASGMALSELIDWFNTQ